MEKKNMASYTEAQKRAILKYQKETFKSITLKFRHEEIEILRSIAEKKGQSATAYCYEAVHKQMAEDEAKEKEQA